MDNKLKELQAVIYNEYTEEDVCYMFDNEVLEYVDYEQMENEGIEDEYEYYSEYRNGEAESEIIQQLIKFAENKCNVNLTTDEHCDLYDWIKETYEVLNYI